MRVSSFASVVAMLTMTLLSGCQGEAGGEADHQGAPLVEEDPNSACARSPEAPKVLVTPCSLPDTAHRDALDEALSQIGLDRCSIVLDPRNVAVGKMNSFDARRMPDFTTLLTSPLKLPPYGDALAASFDDALTSVHPVSAAIAAAASRRGAPIETCADATWFDLDANDPVPLATAINEASVLFGSKEDASLVATLTPIRLDVQRALVPIVRAIAHASNDVAAARKLSPDLLDQVYATSSFLLDSYKFNFNDTLLAALDGVDVDAMTSAAARVSAVVEASRLDRFRGVSIPAVAVGTPFGPIVLGGASDDVYDAGDHPEAPALLFDTGGNDTYRIPVGAGSLTRAVSVSIDLGGDDLYAYVEKRTTGDGIGHRLPSDGAARVEGRTLSRVMRQGAGILGVGLLFDLGGGDDVYRSLAISQGTGVHGVGVLYDEGGDDSYTAEALSQGAAAWGIGLLLDRSGDDHFTIYAQGQGYGFTKGFGALVDNSGNDTYFADPGDPSLGGDPLYPNGQLPGPPQSTMTGNTSMVQGCGAGHRPDTPDPGFQFPGGMGVLRDRGGDDRYVASVFAQGCSFAMGMGLLLEGGGDDTYEGLYYAQGASAHTSVALLYDAAGSDRYNRLFPIVATSIGVGHDFSVTVHIDGAGDDTYRGPPFSLGSADSNGIGILVNVGGSDQFLAQSTYSLGAASDTEVMHTSRRFMPTIAVFVKAGGVAQYKEGDESLDYSGEEWSCSPNGNDGDRGVGVDRPSSTVSF